MRLRVVHEIHTSFLPPAAGAIRKLRMNPRTYDGQYVGKWRIDVDSDCRLDRILDSYGNLLHNFSLTGPLPGFAVVATGEVEVDDTAGILQGRQHERLPPGLFLRSTRLTEPDAAIRDCAADCRAAAASALDRAHAIKSLLHARLAPLPATAEELKGPATTGCAGVLDAGEATPVAAAHVFQAIAHEVGLPARFVSGYVHRGDRRDAGEAAHAWVEVHVDGLGWVGFDPLEGRCPTDAYVRVAASLDQNGAAFVRGADHGAADIVVTSRAMITQTDY